MTYIIKHMNDGKVGIYCTLKACFPIAGPELREAGVTRIEGTAGGGWFKKADAEQAQGIATMLNGFFGYAEGEEAKVSKPKAKKKAATEDDSLASIGAALIADQAGA